METPIIDPEGADKKAANNDNSTGMQKVLARLNVGAANHIWHDLKPRVTSALVMIVIFLFSVTVGGAVFSAVTIVVAMLMIREWDFLTIDKPSKWGWYGIAYIATACMSMIWLRNMSTPIHPHAGMGLVLYLVSIVIATDVCAYFVGKRIGRNKLAPKISPGKTWEGLAGGVAGAGAAGFLCAAFTPFPFTTTECIVLAMLLAFVAQAGDLFESKLKRDAQVKDSGQLIAGHGGILDRLDGMLTTAPVFAFFVTVSGLQ